MNAKRNALIKKLVKAQKQCQVGVPRSAGAYDKLHELLADFYGLFGQAESELRQLDLFSDEADEGRVDDPGSGSSAAGGVDRRSDVDAHERIPY